MSAPYPSRRNFPTDQAVPPRLPQPVSPIKRYRVVIYRGNELGLSFVARVVMDLTRFGDAEATQRMWEWYHLGKALILITHLERAELYVEQFSERGLNASLEPA